MMAGVPPPPPPPYINGLDHGYSNGSVVPPPPPPPQQADYEAGVPPPPPPPQLQAAQQRQQGGASTSGRPAETPEDRAVRKKAEEDKRRREKERLEKEKRDKIMREKTATAKAAAALKVASPSGAPASAALDSRLRRETPFLAHIRFRNELPEIPSDPKMLVTQAQPDALATFFLTTLEREPRRELLLPSDLGIQISLMDADRYQVPAEVPPLDPADAALLQDGDYIKKESTSSAGFQKGYAGRAKTAGANWLMKTTYISQDSDAARKPVMNEKRAKALREGPAEVNDRERQIANIEASFAAAQQPPVHSKNPALKVKDIWHVFPDAEGWGRKYSLVGFDADPTVEVPAIAALPAALRRRVAAASVLRGFTWQPEKFMAYLVPRGMEQALAEADEERGQDKQDAGLPPSALEGDYTWAKEYNYKILPRADGIERTWFIRFNDETKEAVYCEAEMQIELKKREGSSARRKRKAASEEGDGDGEDGDKAAKAAFVIPSKMSLTTREETEEEVEQRQAKAAKLTTIDEAEAYGDE